MAREASSTSTRYILAALFVIALKYKCFLWEVMWRSTLPCLSHVEYVMVLSSCYMSELSRVLLHEHLYAILSNLKSNSLLFFHSQIICCLWSYYPSEYFLLKFKPHEDLISYYLLKLGFSSSAHPLTSGNTWPSSNSNVVSIEVNAKLG